MTFWLHGNTHRMRDSRELSTIEEINSCLKDWSGEVNLTCSCDEKTSILALKIFNENKNFSPKEIFIKEGQGTHEYKKWKQYEEGEDYLEGYKLKLNCIDINNKHSEIYGYIGVKTNFYFEPVIEEKRINFVTKNQGH